MAPSPSYVLRGTSAQPAEPAAVPVASMIEVEALSKRFGETRALDQITLSVGQARWLRCSDRTERAKPPWCAS